MSLPTAEEAKRRLYAMGKELMGPNCGGLVTRLLRTCNEDPFRALCCVQQMKLDGIGMPRDYLTGMLKTQGDKPLKDREANALFGPDLEPETVQRWQLASKALAEQDTPLYRSWFAPLVLVNTHNGQFVFRAPSKFHASRVRMEYEQTLSAAMGAPCLIFSDEGQEAKN